jgi:hypothetical protein
MTPLGGPQALGWGGGEEGEKIRKANHPRGQPTCCPGEKGEKKKVEEFLNRSRGVLEASIVSLAPNTPQKREVLFKFRIPTPPIMPELDPGPIPKH